MSLPRLFVAVWPPEHTNEALRALPRKDGSGVRFVPPENWHVTLRFLGDCAAADVVDAMEGVPLPASTARLGPAVDLLHPRTLVAPVSGLDEIASAVVAATQTIGDPPPPRPFRGHVTIARRTRQARVPSVLGQTVRSEWDVTEVALVLSRLHPDGARYETIHRWPTT